MPFRPAIRRSGYATSVRYSLLLCIFCLAVYTLTSYGGIRTPDSEIVFRTGRIARPFRLVRDCPPD